MGPRELVLRRGEVAIRLTEGIVSKRLGLRVEGLAVRVLSGMIPEGR